MVASFRDVVYQFLVRQRESGKGQGPPQPCLPRSGWLESPPPPVPSSHLACLDFLEKAEKGIIVLSVPEILWLLM